MPASEVYDAQTTSVTTLYTRMGDWLGALCLLFTVVGLLWVRMRKRAA